MISLAGCICRARSSLSHARFRIANAGAFLTGKVATPCLATTCLATTCLASLIAANCGYAQNAASTKAPDTDAQTSSVESPSLTSPALESTLIESTPTESSVASATTGDIDSLRQQIQALQSTVDWLSQEQQNAAITVANQPAPITMTDDLGYHRHGRNRCNHIGCYYKNFNWSDDAYVSVGGGLRTSYLTAEDGAANGSSNSNDWRIDNARMYFNGRGHKYLAFEMNLDIQNTNVTPASTANGNPSPFRTESAGTRYRLLDGIGKIGDGGALNVWFGRMLPPSDRSNLSGPFYLNTYDYPFTSNLPAVFAGRQDGFAVWGLIFNQSVKYQVGLFDGADSIVNGTNPKDSPQFNARVVWNLLDPETGYYNQSTYYGTKDILAIGATVVNQNNGFYSATDGNGDFTSWSLDALAERKLANDGVLTLCGAYYNYDTHILTNDLNANALDGNAGMVVAGYMFPGQCTIGQISGRLRPVFRWQKYDHTFSNASAAAGTFDQGIDLEMQYVMYGHNARLSASWGQRDVSGGQHTINIGLLGAQFQF